MKGRSMRMFHFIHTDDNPQHYKTFHIHIQIFSHRKIGSEPKSDPVGRGPWHVELFQLRPCFVILKRIVKASPVTCWRYLFSFVYLCIRVETDMLFDLVCQFDTFFISFQA